MSDLKYRPGYSRLGLKEQSRTYPPEVQAAMDACKALTKAESTFPNVHAGRITLAHVRCADAGRALIEKEEENGEG